MRGKQEALILYVKIRVSAKIGGLGKAKGWQPILADTCVFRYKLSFDSKAKDEGQSGNVHSIRENAGVC